MTDQLNQILDRLPGLTNSDDVRWLLRYAAVEAGIAVNIRGIGYHGYVRSPLLQEMTALVDKLERDDLLMLHKMLNLLYEGLRPKSDAARGVVEIKTVHRDYPELDGDTGLPALDEQGRPIRMAFAYRYVYIRLYAGKGDADRRRRKLLSVYADQGMGRGGSGGYVAAALDKGLITEVQILDAYHGADYAAFIDECAALLAESRQSGDSGADKTKPLSDVAAEAVASDETHRPPALTGIKRQQKRDPQLPEIRQQPAVHRLEPGDLAILQPGYAASWANKRRKRRFDDGEMVVIAARQTAGDQRMVTIHKLDKPKVVSEVLDSQLMPVVEVIQGELAVPLNPDQLESVVKERLQKLKPSQRAALAQATYYLLQAGGAADLENVKVEDSSPYRRELVFSDHYRIWDLIHGGFLTTVAEADRTSRERLTPLGILAARWLKATFPAFYADIGQRPLPKKILKIALWLRVERNSSFVRGKKKVIEWIERVILSQYDMEKAENGDYLLSIPYEDIGEIDDIIDEIFMEAAREADLHYCFTEDEGAKALDGSDRYW